MIGSRALAIASLAILVGAGTPALAQGAGDEKGAFGLGLIVGEPTGVSAKLYLSDDQAIAGAVGGAVIGRGIQIHADYLFHPWILETTDTFVLPAYLGPGLRILNHDRGRGIDNDVHIGARGVLGMLFDFRRVPLDVFVEVAGIIEYRTASGDHGGVGFDLNAGAGVRYYF
jgi:hypothetical protein